MSESLIYRIAGDLDKAMSVFESSSPDYYLNVQKTLADFNAECSVAKVYCSEVLKDYVDEVLQIFGGYGFTQDYPAERFYRDERINRIFEGTNEINRMLLPGTVLKKAMKGELPLNQEAMKAFEALMSPSFEELDEEIRYAKEKKLIADMKQIFLFLSGAAVQKHGVKLANEQEILLASADVAMDIYALESAVLRADKGYEKASDKKKALFDAVVTSAAFEANERLATQARRAAFYVEEGDTLTMLLSGIRRYTKYNAEGLLEAHRLLARAALDANRYPFS